MAGEEGGMICGEIISLFPTLAGYIGLYIFYVLTVVVSTWLHRRQRRENLAASAPTEPGEGASHMHLRHVHMFIPYSDWSAASDLSSPPQILPSE